MTNYIPLNGSAPIQKIHRALAGGGFTQAPSAVASPRDGLHRDGRETPPDEDDDRPDGTGYGSKSYPSRDTERGSALTGSKPLAVDPSQGSGGTNKPKRSDPLLDALRQLPSVGYAF